jgi:hypothetical protein
MMMGFGMTTDYRGWQISEGYISYYATHPDSTLKWMRGNGSVTASKSTPGTTSGLSDGFAIMPHNKLPETIRTAIIRDIHGTRLSIADLSKRHDVSTATVSRLIVSEGLKGKRESDGHGKLQREMPADFAERAATMTDAALAKHYHMGTRVVRRLRLECGVRSQDARKAATTAARARWEGHEKRKRPTGYQRAANTRVTVDKGRSMDLASRAVDECLLRHFRINRCREDGSFDASGKWWRVERHVRSPEWVIEKERSKGWLPNAWERL